MIETLETLLRLVGGLASIELVGLGLIILILPQNSSFTSLERLSLGFGMGSLALTLWMLGLSFWGVSFNLVNILLPWLIILKIILVPSSRRKLWLQDVKQAGSLCRRILTLGQGTSLSVGARGLLALLLLTFLFVLLRAAIYPIWAWDAISTWGLKAKAFYLHGLVDMSSFEAHNYYPNLVPLLMSYLYLWLGEVKDSVVQAVFPVWGGCLALLFYSLLRRLQVAPARALGGTAFLVLNGATLITHMFIAYADLALTYYTLATVGLLYLWLKDEAPPGSLVIAACLGGGMLWSKYEGLPLVLINFLALGLTLLWLRPPPLTKKLIVLFVTAGGTLLFYLPWRIFVHRLGIDIGADHLGGFYPEQLNQAVYFLGRALVWPPYFGLFWPVIFLSLAWQGKYIFTSPLLFLVLLLTGNLAALLLAYTVAPTSAAEFPLYVRATIDRLLLHIVPALGLILAAPLAAGSKLFRQT